MVFGTAEHQIVPAENLTEAPDIARLNDDPDFFVVTPSVWSSEGFRALGLEPAKVRVIPHGVETSVFSPDRRGRAALRKRLGLDGFAFLNCGAMTSNKGIDVLLRAFVILLETRNDVWLVLKGNDRVYGSRGLLAQYFKDMPAHTRQRLLDRTLYIGDTFAMHDMAALYRACDAYVSPYRAEGFNMPFWRPPRASLPILCTRGGPTDDFVTDRFAVGVDATLNSSPHGNWLEPDIDHLVQLMERSISDLAFQHSALDAGPAHVAATYRWDHAVQAMLAV